MGKFGSKNSKLFPLPETRHTEYLNYDNSYSNISFPNFQSQIYFWSNLGQKSQHCPFCLKIGTQGISTMLIFIPTLVFWLSNPKSSFGRDAISRMLILIPTLVFSISNPDCIFGQIWVEKVKVVGFTWKLAHMLSQGSWFLFPQQFSQFPILIVFFVKFG